MLKRKVEPIKEVEETVEDKQREELEYLYERLKELGISRISQLEVMINSL